MQTTNASTELQKLIQKVKRKYNADLLAVDIRLDTSKYGLQKNDERIKVKFMMSKEDKSIEELLSPIDRNYNSGFGTQYLFGVVWFTNGIWATRYEYDGGEWWDLHVYPSLSDFEEEQFDPSVDYDANIEMPE